MSVNDIRDFTYENYYKQIGLSFIETLEKKKDLLLLANKLIEKVPDPRNAKQYFESVLRKKKRKSVKQSEILLINQKLLKTQTLLI